MSTRANRAGPEREIAAPYSGYAAIYDRIMVGVDYEGWVDYVEALLQPYGCKPTAVLDLACGTGSSTLPFAARGYRVSGIDLSGPMLELAQAKAAAAALPVEFHRMDLRALELTQRFDLAVLFQDGLNYLLTDEELLQAFTGVRDLLLPGGFFIFDLTRPSLRNSSEQPSVYWYEEEGFTLVWESRYHRETATWALFLTVFISETGGLYRKYREQHREKDHLPETVEKLLAEAGLTLLGVHPTYRLDPARDGEAKLTFVARRG
ncbi:MAG: class I SAM-dependent methyltransferase [Firmicutes bacterium]|nr:class I SAM-dependent methyltransferase [Bacillota bacterium]